jgi:hypothetical protein
VAAAGRPAPNPSSLPATDAEETTMTLMTTDRRARFLLAGTLVAGALGTDWPATTASRLVRPRR